MVLHTPQIKYYDLLEYEYPESLLPRSFRFDQGKKLDRSSRSVG
jgi:hypothetical protein